MNKRLLSKKVKPVKNLLTILKKRSGRDNSGQISVRHQGGRQKRFYREIDPDDIFLDSQNISSLDKQQFEGKIEK